MPRKEREVEITKVVIKVGENEFKLSLEEAKALRDILTNTFPLPTNPIPIYVSTPIYIDRYVPRPYGPYWVWGASETATTFDGQVTAVGSLYISDSAPSATYLPPPAA